MKIIHDRIKCHKYNQCNYPKNCSYTLYNHKNAAHCQFKDHKFRDCELLSYKRYGLQMHKKTLHDKENKWPV